MICGFLAGFGGNFIDGNSDEFFSGNEEGIASRKASKKALKYSLKSPQK
jgi:hypothetical protein